VLAALPLRFKAYVAADDFSAISKSARRRARVA